MNLKEYKNNKYPFEEYLKEIHAKNYMGTDDDMSDSFESFVCNFDLEDVVEHANAFSKMLLDLIK
jgi:hypothetical protein